MPITSSVNYRFAFNDFEFGGGDSVYQIMTLDGLEDLPTIRNQDDNRGYQDGMWTGRDFLSGRTLVFEMIVRGDANGSMNYYLDLLQANLIPQQQGTGILQFKLPNSSVQRINARVRRRAVTINTDYSSGMATVIYEFFCPDPRYYDDTLQTIDLYNPAVFTTGRTYNRVYTTAATPNGVPSQTGMSFGGGSAATNAVTNNGWTTTYPQFTITGPCTNPKVTNTANGNYLLVNTTMISTDQLVIDTDLRTVTLNGINRRALLNNASTWFAAPPGISYYSFDAQGTGAGTSCITTWRSAYI